MTTHPHLPSQLNRTAAAAPARKSGREGYKVNWWLTALMLVASLTVLVPLYFTVAMALKTPRARSATGTGFEWPSPVQWENFADAYWLTNFPRAFMVDGARHRASASRIAGLPARWWPTPSPGTGTGDSSGARSSTCSLRCSSRSR